MILSQLSYFLLLLFALSSNIYYNKKVFITTFFFAFMFIALRDINVGRDTVVYKQIFDAVASGSTTNYFVVTKEKGYIFLNSLFSDVGLGFRGIMVLSAAVPVYAFYKIIAKYGDCKYTALVVFLVFTPFFFLHSGMRQGIAIGFGVFAIISVYENRKLLSLLYIFLATLFHLSSIVLILCYLFKFKYSKKLLLSLVLFSFILSAFSGLYISLISSVFSFAPERYMHLISSGLASGSGLGLRSLLITSLSALILWKVSLDNINQFFIVGGVFYVCCNNLFSSLEIVSRLYLYFSPFLSIFLSYFPRVVPLPNVINRIVVFLVMAIFLTRSMSTDTLGIFL
ncbi:EpsK [Vibrio maritimus]|uniref:EpsK n=1 Tax=Vibrio maritimus TaxID=990268 RepID=A0A090SRU7_9VIBR|nr:EpsK [Vibrio maritimus]